MKKQILIPTLPLLVLVFFLAGCEKPKSGAKEKNQVEKPVAEEQAPLPETMTEKEESEIIKEPEIIENKEKSVTLGDSPATDNQKFEGSQTLNRYMDDSPKIYSEN